MPSYYERNKEKEIERARLYRRNNKEKRAETQRNWARNHPEAAKAIDRRTREKNKDARKARAAAWYAKNAERLKEKAHHRFESKKTEIMKKQREYAGKNKARIKEASRRRQPRFNKLRREKYRNNPSYRLRSIVGSRISNLVSQRRADKAGRTMVLIGCDIEFLRGYLQARFLKGMSWENYGEWHIDHRIPCAKFDLREPEQQRQCFHYSNLRPMWGPDNLAKGGKMPGVHQAELV